MGLAKNSEPLFGSRQQNGPRVMKTSILQFQTDYAVPVSKSRRVIVQQSLSSKPRLSPLETSACPKEIL